MNEIDPNSDKFTEIIQRFSSFIKKNIHKFNPQTNGIDPEDIYQEVKIRIWRILKNEKKIDNYTSYIMKIVNSTVIDQIRKSRRQGEIILAEKQKNISENRITYKILNKEESLLKDIVGQAADNLKESRKKVVKLYLLNLTIEEIAALFGWTKHKTRNLLYRGLNDLKTELKNQGIDYGY
ncbi:MAG: sigma-70 family RNA polymerase sigma factor [Candidatus Aminicenantes bacterium]|nr:sigma-70 family RNA polymerase sigma factor [Candidatus Aminicenantes bacterium]